MSRWKKILSILVVLSVAVVVAGIAILKSLDLNDYKGLIAEQVKTATGRDMTISGDLNLEISLNPSVVVQGVTFANAPWGSRKDMVRLNRFAAEVELLPLLTGDIRVKRLVLDGLDLLAETNAQGQGNWELKTAGTKAETKKSDAGPGTLPVINWVSIKNLKVSFRDGTQNKTTTLRLDNMDVRTDSLKSPMNIDLAGDFNGLALKASGQLGPLEALINGGQPYPVSLDFSTTGLSATVRGVVSEPSLGRGLNLKLTLDASDLGPLAGAAGVTLPKLPPIKVSGLFSDPKGGYKIAGLNAVIGSNDLKGDLSVTLKGRARPFLDADLTTTVINLDALLPKGPAPAKKPAKKKDRVFPADPLPLDGLKAADARVRFRVGKIVTNGITLKDTDLRLVLGAGRLDIKPLNTTVGGGKVIASLVLDSSVPATGLSVNLDAKQIDYGAILNDLKMTDIATGKLDAKINLKGKGASIAKIMAGLNGRTRITTEGGKIESGALNILSADIMSALPFSDSKGDKTIRCGVVDFDIRRGQAKAKALIFETGGLSMIGTGGVNLGDETIRIKVNPRAKKISLIKLAMVPVNVGGTLANPTAAPDLAGTATSVITGTLSTAKGITSGGVSAIGNLVGLGGKKDDGTPSDVDNTDYCKLALAGRPLVRDKASAPKSTKTSAPKSTETSTPKSTVTSTSPPTEKLEEGSTMDNVDKKLDSLGKGLGGALKGLFGK
ncbi:MAG: AsmA family protein [Rhodospirillales bacterium]